MCYINLQLIYLLPEDNCSFDSRLFLFPHYELAVVGLFRAMQELQIKFQPESSVASALPGSISTSSETVSGKTVSELSAVISTVMQV